MNISRASLKLRIFDAAKPLEAAREAHNCNYVVIIIITIMRMYLQAYRADLTALVDWA